MSEQQRRDAELCWQYIQNAEDLDDLISRVKSRGDPVKRKERELERLKKKLMEIPASEGAEQNSKSGLKRWFSRFLPPPPSREPERRELAEKIEKATKKLDELKTQPQTNQEIKDDEPVRSAARRLSREQLLQMREKRQELVKRIVGESFFNRQPQTLIDHGTASSKLFVGNLSDEVTEKDLKSLFSQAGSVVSVNVMTDRITRLPRGFGFVEMATELEASRAISMFHGKELNGRQLTVNEARPREK